MPPLVNLLSTQEPLIIKEESLKEPVDAVVEEVVLPSDIDWKEYNYHNGNTSEDASSSASPAFVLFPSAEEDEEDDDEFSFKYPGLPEIVLRGESDIGGTKVFKVTGMGIWSAKYLCKFLVSNPQLVQGRQVLELGAGTGLAGIVAHHLGASKVILTDGDLHALQNLRFNATKNTSPVVPCPQLIWGEEVEAFHRRYGSFQVILACDCIYMNKCIAPFWETVDRLLSGSSDRSESTVAKDDHVQSCLIYINTCPAQDTFDEFAGYAGQYGFEEFYKMETVVRDVHFFRRKM